MSVRTNVSMGIERGLTSVGMHLSGWNLDVRQELSEISKPRMTKMLETGSFHRGYLNGCEEPGLIDG